MAQYSATELTPAQVAQFQTSIDAVIAGTATIAEAHECLAAIEGLWSWARLPWQAARDIIVGRQQILERAPEAAREAVAAALDGGKETPQPRISYDESDLSFPNIAVHDLSVGIEVAQKPLPPPLYMSLHSKFPGRAATQNTEELNYPGYARQVFDPAAKQITFPEMGEGEPQTVTWICLGREPAGVGEVVSMWPLGSPADGLVVSKGTSPQITPPKEPDGA
jgi:hypothetical protein